MISTVWKSGQSQNYRNIKIPKGHQGLGRGKIQDIKKNRTVENVYLVTKYYIMPQMIM